jgi:hypothetical protein
LNVFNLIIGPFIAIWVSLDFKLLFNVALLFYFILVLFCAGKPALFLSLIISFLPSVLTVNKFFDLEVNIPFSNGFSSVFPLFSIEALAVFYGLGFVMVIRLLSKICLLGLITIEFLTCSFLDLLPDPLFFSIMLSFGFFFT